MLSGDVFARCILFPKASHGANGDVICNVMSVGDVGPKLHTSLSMTSLCEFHENNVWYIIIYCFSNYWNILPFLFEMLYQAINSFTALKVYIEL